MLRAFINISLLFITATSLTAQEVVFDDQHPTDGAIYLKLVDGIETLVNSDNEPIIAHSVFRMDANEIMANGWGKTISRHNASNDIRDIGGATFNLTYLDQVNATGNGFDHPTLGAQRRNSLEAAFEYYSSIIEDYGVADIEIRESFSANPNNNPFAFSAAYYFGSKGFNSPFTKSHIVSGIDPYNSFPDGYLQFNFHQNLKYNYAVSADPSDSEYDFYTIALHEILHLLGFTSYSTENGQSAASVHVFTSFDENLTDYNKDEIFSLSGNGASTQVSIPDDGFLTNNQVWFELYPSQFAPVFSPDPFNASSLDHFDNNRSNDGKYLMHPSLINGRSFKVLHEDEVRVLEILGYAVNYGIATSIDEHLNTGAPTKTLSGLYPNPAYSSDEIKIDLIDIDNPEVLVIVYDMLGRQSYSKVILNNGSGPVTAIDPYNNLTPGMYIVVGSTNDELFNEKLVIKQ